MTEEQKIICKQFLNDADKTHSCNEYKLLMQLLEQEPFINKPCVSSEVCEHDKQKVLNKIRAEIEQDLEQDKIARSVFRYEKINAVKAEQCTGSIAAYHSVIGIIDKYKAGVTGK